MDKNIRAFGLSPINVVPYRKAVVTKLVKITNLVDLLFFSDIASTVV